MRRSIAALLLIAALGLAAPAAQAAAIFQSFVGTGIDSYRGGRGGPVASRGSGDRVVLPGARGSDRVLPWTPSTEIRYRNLNGDSRAFRSELAAVSWNALMARIAQTPPANLDHISIRDFDPGLPLRPQGCSFTRPDRCDVAGTFFPTGDTRGNNGSSAAIPEPGAALLFGAGFALVGARTARRRLR